MPVLNLRTRGGGGMMSGRGNSDNSSMASGSKFKARNSGNVELSLYERLQQENELDEQKLQSQQQYNSSGNSSRGPMMDSDHNNIINSSHKQSDQQSVGSGWTWATRSTQSHAFRINQKYGTTKSYIGSTLFGGENVITSRIKSAMNCNRDKSHVINQGGIRRDGKEEEENEKEQFIKQQQQNQSSTPFNMMTLLKLALFILILLMGIRTINKQKHHNSNSSSNTTTEQEESLLQISEEYLESSIRGASDSISSGISELTSNTIVHTATFPQHLSHLTNLTNMYNPKIETPYFWDVHFSGESIAEHVFSSCYGLILACEFGLRQPDYNEEVSFGLFDYCVYVMY